MNTPPEIARSVAQLKHDVESTLGQVRGDLRTMRDDAAQDRALFLCEVRTWIEGLKLDVASGAEHRQEQRQTTARRVAEIRDQARSMMGRYRDERINHERVDAEQRLAYLARLRGEVDTLLSNARSTRAQWGARTPSTDTSHGMGHGPTVPPPAQPGQPPTEAAPGRAEREAALTAAERYNAINVTPAPEPSGDGASVEEPVERVEHAEPEREPAQDQTPISDPLATANDEPDPLAPQQLSRAEMLDQARAILQRARRVG